VKLLVTIIGFLGSAGLWIWAMSASSEVVTLPEKYRGTFELFRFEAGMAPGAVDPISQKQRWIYTFEEDRSFQIRVLVPGDWEMLRRSGTVATDGEDRLVLTRASENGMHMQSETGEPLQNVAERYYVQWGTDEEGPYLHLTQELASSAGQQLFLRRQE
jgi:hypothetical protein